METVATTKGQVVIPSKVRKQLDIKVGTRFNVEVDEKGRRIILRPITRQYVHSLRGRLKGTGVMKALAAEKKREKEL